MEDSSGFRTTDNYEILKAGIVDSEDLAEVSTPSRLQSFEASFARIDSAGGDVFSYNVGSVEVIGSANVVYVNSERMTEAPRIPAPRCQPASQNFVGRVVEQEQMVEVLLWSRRQARQSQSLSSHWYLRLWEDAARSQVYVSGISEIQG